MRHFFRYGILSLFIFSSCSKSNSTTNGTGTGTGAGPANALKTQISVTNNPGTSTIYDSIIYNFSYDKQSRLVATTEHDWNNTSGTPAISNSNNTVTYTAVGAILLTYFNNSSNPSNQTYYYVNASSYLDSSKAQVYINGTWHTTQKQTYTYNAGYVNKSIQTNYDSLTGAVTDVINDFHTWQNGDEVYDSTIDSYNSVSITNKTFYSNSSQGIDVIANSTVLLQFKGTASTDILKSEAITTYIGALAIPLPVFGITYTLDGNNRVNTISVSLNGSSSVYTKDFFSYY